MTKGPAYLAHAAKPDAPLFNADAPGTKTVTNLVTQTDDVDPATAIRQLLVRDELRERLESAFGVPLETRELRHQLTNDVVEAHVLPRRDGPPVYLIQFDQILLRTEHRTMIADFQYQLPVERPLEVRLFASPRDALPLVFENLLAQWRNLQINVDFVPWLHLTDAADNPDPADAFTRVLKLDVPPVAVVPPAADQPVAAPADHGAVAVAPPAVTRSGVFISYASVDGPWKDRLVQMLAPISEKLELWVDDEIKAGEKWFDEIQQALDRAKIAVMMVTPAFLASEFITTEEIPTLLEAEKDGGCTIYVICVKSSLVHKTVLEQFQYARATPPSAPLESMQPYEINAALQDIGDEISELMSDE